MLLQAILMIEIDDGVSTGPSTAGNVLDWVIDVLDREKGGAPVSVTGVDIPAIVLSRPCACHPDEPEPCTH